jgi:hypothetical protein
MLAFVGDGSEDHDDVPDSVTGAFEAIVGSARWPWMTAAAPSRMDRGDSFGVSASEFRDALDACAPESSTRFGGGAHLFRANPQAQQMVSMLSALYKSMAPLYDPDGALMRDPDAWGKVQLDDRFRAFIQQRVAKVGRNEFVIEPATDALEDVFAAATVEPFMRAIPAFSSARRHLAKFAFHGRSHAWIEGRREWRVAGRSETFPSGFLAEWWAPSFIRPLDKRQIIYQPQRVKGLDGSDVVRVKTLLGTIDAGKHVGEPEWSMFDVSRTIRCVVSLGCAFIDRALSVASCFWD